MKTKMRRWKRGMTKGRWRRIKRRMRWRWRRMEEEVEECGK